MISFILQNSILALLGLDCKYNRANVTNSTFLISSIFLIITLYLQLLLDKCLLFLDIISIRVPDYLDTTISCLVITFPLDWNIGPYLVYYLDNRLRFLLEPTLFISVDFV